MRNSSPCSRHSKCSRNLSEFTAFSKALAASRCIYCDSAGFVTRQQLGCGSSARKDNRSNKCHTKELEILPARRQQPLSRRRKRRLSGERRRQSDLGCNRSSYRSARQTRAAGSGGRVTLCGFIELATLHPLLCRSSGVGSLDQSNGNHSRKWKVTDGAAAHVCDFVIFDL